MNVYVRADDWRERREQARRRSEGRIAIYRLLLAQREATGGDAGYARGRLALALGDRAAAEQAPEGTAFIGRSAGGGGRIWVVAPGGRTVYEGPADGYADRASAGA